MKATINGIAVEGTPQEIAEYLKRMDDMRKDGVHIKPPLGQAPDWLKSQFKSLASGYWKCSNDGPCYCTGACKM